MVQAMFSQDSNTPSNRERELQVGFICCWQQAAMVAHTSALLPDSGTGRHFFSINPMRQDAHSGRWSSQALVQQKELELEERGRLLFKTKVPPGNQQLCKPRDFAAQPHEACRCSCKPSSCMLSAGCHRATAAGASCQQTRRRQHPRACSQGQPRPVSDSGLKSLPL